MRTEFEARNERFYSVGPRRADIYMQGNKGPSKIILALKKPCETAMKKKTKPPDETHDN